jgi:hypothetical protein
VIGAAQEYCASAQWGEPVYARTANNRSTRDRAPADRSSIDARQCDESTGVAWHARSHAMRQSTQGTE